MDKTMITHRLTSRIKAENAPIEVILSFFEF